MADLDDTIESAAEGPKRVSVDGQTVEQHELEQLVAADRYLQSKNAARSKRRGLVINKLRAPGTV